MKVKIAELTGNALDAAVAIAEGIEVYCIDGHYYYAEQENDSHGQSVPAYSSDFHFGMDIVTRERIATWSANESAWAALHPNSSGLGGFYVVDGMRSGTALDVDSLDGMPGATLLIAAMRAYLQSCLGDDIELPESK